MLLKISSPDSNAYFQKRLISRVGMIFSSNGHITRSVWCKLVGEAAVVATYCAVSLYSAGPLALHQGAERACLLGSPSRERDDAQSVIVIVMSLSNILMVLYSLLGLCMLCWGFV